MWQLLRRLRSSEPDLAVILPEPLAGQVRALLSEGRTVEAVRLTRRRTGLDLLTAVRAVDAMASTPPSSPA
jgi:hypothetical protein